VSDGVIVDERDNVTLFYRDFGLREEFAFLLIDTCAAYAVADPAAKASSSVRVKGFIWLGLLFTGTYVD